MRPPPRAVAPPSWRKRLVLFAAILTASIALSPAAGRRPGRAGPSTAAGTHSIQRPGSGASLSGAHLQRPLAARASNAPTGGSVAGAGRVLIDGRVNPEAISDLSAAAILLPMIAPTPNNTAARERHRQAMLAEARFSATDAQIVQRVLAPLHQQVEEKRRLATAARKAAEIDATAVNMATLKDAVADLHTPATRALAQLQRELSPDGVARLRKQLDRVKANTKILDR